MDSLRTPSWRREEDARPLSEPEQPGQQPETQPSPSASQATHAPGNVVSGSGIPLAAAAAMEGVPSVQALRKRIKKGTLQSVRVLHRDSIVVGVELEELARHYPGAFGSEGTTTPPPDAHDKQPQGHAEQPGTPPEAHERPHSAPIEEQPVAPEPQPEETADEQPGATGAQELQTVDVAIQGWREAREALEVSRREHREELTRTIASYESLLRARDTQGAEATRIHGAREARAVRWGRAAAITLLAALVIGNWLMGRAGDRLADERVRAGILTEQTRALIAEKVALEGALDRQGAALEEADSALERAKAEASLLDGERQELQRQLLKLQAEQEQARAAARAALQAMGLR